MKRKLVWLISSLMAVCATAADAAGNMNSMLLGDYGVTGTGICTHAFGPVTTFTLKGVRTFHGDGTGTSHLTVHSGPAGVFGSAADIDTTDPFTYAVGEDGSWIFTVDAASFKGTFLSGPNAGLTFSVDQFPSMAGFIEDETKSLTAVTEGTLVETATLSDGVVDRRTCQSSSVLIQRQP